MDSRGLDVFSAMQTGVPLARFQKTIVGGVLVRVINPFTDMPESLILTGEGKSSYIEIWREKDLAFFKRFNEDHFKAGRLKELKEIPAEERSPNEITDEEIEALLDTSVKFFALKARVEKFTDVAPVLRVLNRARELEKSEKLVRYLEGRMADLELDKYEA